MNLFPLLKRLVPGPLRPPLRKCVRLLYPASTGYQSRVQNEIHTFNDTDVQDLPAILNYWSESHIVPIFTPFGFRNSIEFFRTYLKRVCNGKADRMCAFATIGAGTCATEINIAEWLREVGVENYTFECVDINPQLLQRASARAGEKGLSRHFTFSESDVNKWRPGRQYDAILAVQSLHHVVKLEALLDSIRRALQPDGYFLTDDMIGRNGHQRWPEALKFVEELWLELPDKYKYNRGTQRLEKRFENADCSTEGFEGIRSQDILPLLVEHFQFDLFIAFGNIIDIFVDRTFGPNFDPANEWDRAFIDRVHALDSAEIESGRVKPTHILAAMKNTPVAQTLTHKHLSPEFCIRRPANDSRK